MLKACVICECSFDATGKHKTCSPECSHELTNKRTLEWHKRRYATEPAYAERVKKWQRDKYHDDPEYAALAKKRAHDRYHKNK